MANLRRWYTYLNMTLQTTDVQVIGAELAIRWSDGGESFIAMERLRRSCPCAGCNGERDIMGNLYKSPEKPLVEQSFRLTGVSHVGGYALQPIWGDGHSTGIYSFEYLRRLAEPADSVK